MEMLNDILLYQKLGKIISKKIIKTRITPNQISYFGFLCFILSAYFFSKTGYIMVLIGLAFFQLAYIADYVDGILAKLKGACSEYGAWLDLMSGFLGYPIVYVGISLGVYSQIPKPYVLLLGLLVITASFVKSGSQNAYRLTFPSASKLRKKIYKKWRFLLAFRFTHRLVVPVLTIGAVFNKLYWVLLFFGIYAPIYVFAQTVILLLQARRESLKEGQKK